MRCEIVLLVENLDICRYFYREVLKLDPMVTDSNFQTVFQLSEQCTLRLEKCELPFLEHLSGACSFSLETGDLPALQERMQKNGTPLEKSFSRSGVESYRGRDPEGNFFQITEATVREN